MIYPLNKILIGLLFHYLTKCNAAKEDNENCISIDDFFCLAIVYKTIDLGSLKHWWYNDFIKAIH